MPFNEPHKNVRTDLLNDNIERKRTGPKGSTSCHDRKCIWRHTLLVSWLIIFYSAIKYSFSIKKETPLYPYLFMADSKDWFLVYSSWKQVKSCSLGAGEFHVSNGTGVLLSKDKVGKAMLEI